MLSLNRDFVTTTTETLTPQVTLHFNFESDVNARWSEILFDDRSPPQCPRLMQMCYLSNQEIRQSTDLQLSTYFSDTMLKLAQIAIAFMLVLAQSTKPRTNRPRSKLDFWTYMIGLMGTVAAIDLEPQFDLTSYCCSSYSNPAFSSNNGFASALHDFSTGPYEITADFTNIAPLVRVDEVKMKKSGYGSSYEDRYIQSFKLKYKNQFGTWIESGFYDTGFTDSDDYNFVRVVARPEVMCSEMIIYLDDRSMFVDGDGQDYILMRIGFTGEVVSGGGMELLPEWEFTNVAGSTWADPSLTSPRGFSSASTHDWSTPYEIVADFTDIASFVEIDEVMIAKRGDGWSEEYYLNSVKIKYKNQFDSWIELGKFDTGFVPSDGVDVIKTIALSGVKCSQMILYLDSTSMFEDGNRQKYATGRIAFTGEIVTDEITSEELEPEFELTSYCCSSWTNPAFSNTNGFASALHDFSTGPYEITADFTNIAPLVRVDDVMMKKSGWGSSYEDRYITSFKLKYKNQLGSWIESGWYNTGFTDSDDMNFVRVVARPRVVCSEMILYLDDRSMFVDGNGQDLILMRIGFTGEVVTGDVSSGIELLPEWDLSHDSTDSSWEDPSLSSSYGFGSDSRYWYGYYEITADFTNIAPLVRVDQVQLAKRGDVQTARTIDKVFIKYKNQAGSWVELGEFITGQTSEDASTVVRTIAYPGVTCSEMVVYFDRSMLSFPGGNNYCQGRLGFIGEVTSSVDLNPEWELTNSISDSWLDPSLSSSHGFGSSIQTWDPYFEIRATFTNISPLVRVDEVLLSKNGQNFELTKLIYSVFIKYKDVFGQWVELGEFDTGQLTEDSYDLVRTIATPGVTCSEMVIYLDSSMVYLPSGWNNVLGRVGFRGQAIHNAQVVQSCDQNSPQLSILQADLAQCEDELEECMSALSDTEAERQTLQYQYEVASQETITQNEARLRCEADLQEKDDELNESETARSMYEISLESTQNRLINAQQAQAQCDQALRIEQEDSEAARTQCASDLENSQVQLILTESERAVCVDELTTVKVERLQCDANLTTTTSMLELNAAHGQDLALAEQQLQQCISRESTCDQSLAVCQANTTQLSLLYEGAAADKQRQSEELIAAQVEIDQLRTNQSGYEAEIARLQGELENSESRIQELETRLTVSESNLTVVESRNEILQASLNEITEQYNTCEANNADLSSLFYYRSTVLTQRRDQLLDEYLNSVNETRAAEIQQEMVDIVREQANNDDYIAEAESKHQQQQELIATVTLNNERCGNDLSTCQETSQTTQAQLNQVTEQNVILTDQIVEQTSVSQAEIQRLSNKVEETQGQLQNVNTLYDQVDSQREQCQANLTDTESLRSQCEVELANCTEFVETREASGFNPFNCNRGSSQSLTTNFAEETGRLSQQATLRSEPGDANATDQTIAQDGKLSGRLLLIILGMVLLVILCCVGCYVCKTSSHPSAKVANKDVEAPQLQLGAKGGEPDSQNTKEKETLETARPLKAQNSTEEIGGRTPTSGEK